MPRLVQYLICELSTVEVAPVGPPWLITNKGGSSSVGGEKSGFFGGKKNAKAVKPFSVGNSMVWGKERKAGSITISLERRRTSGNPVVKSRLMIAADSVGDPALNIA